MTEMKTLKSIGSSEIGYLSFFQDKDITFKIKRIYYIYEARKGVERGFHAHKKLKQFAWCPYGDVTFILDDGHVRQEVRLNTPAVGIEIDKGVWREMIWNIENSVLCVAASDYYDENDYIRDYYEFLRMVREGYWNGTSRN